MGVTTKFLAFAAIIAIVNCSPTTEDIERATNAREFEASQVGVIISPILSAFEIRRIEIYWSHSCLRSGDSIALYTRVPSNNAAPIHSFRPTTTSGIRKTGITANFVPSSNLSFRRQCLGYYVAWLRNGVIMKTNCLETQPTWMADRRNRLGPRRFRDIFLPGTHNSGSYSINRNPTIDNIVNKYAICQDEDILAQLIYGVRYLDIRVGHYPNMNPVWWVNHGMVRIVSMQRVIDDIKTFLDRTQEIVIFDVQEFPVGFGNDLTIHRQLVAYLERQFAGYIAPRSLGWSASLDRIWASGRRLIIGYDQSTVVSTHNTIWPRVTHQWGNVRTLSALYTYLRRIESNAIGSTVVNPRSAMAQLTPDTWDVILDRLGGLRRMAEVVNMNVTTWYNTQFQNTANIVAVDFFKGTGIIETAIAWNDRRFSGGSWSPHTCRAN